MRAVPDYRRCLIVVAVVVVVLGLMGCPRKETAATTGPAATSPAPSTPTPAPTAEPAAAQPPPSTVTLTAKLVGQGLASMSDPKVKAILTELKPPGNITLAQMAANAGKAGAHPGI